MLFTIINTLVALGFSRGGTIFEINETKTVVFPAPVGRETPIRETSCLDRSVRHASRHASWYGRRRIVGGWVLVGEE